MADAIRTETNGPLVTGISVGFASVAALFVAGRLYTRGAILRCIGKDDWSILVATVCFVPPGPAVLPSSC
jgi:hypothetical protein